METIRNCSRRHAFAIFTFVQVLSSVLFTTLIAILNRAFFLQKASLSSDSISTESVTHCPSHIYPYAISLNIFFGIYLLIFLYSLTKIILAKRANRIDSASCPLTMIAISYLPAIILFSITFFGLSGCANFYLESIFSASLGVLYVVLFLVSLLLTKYIDRLNNHNEGHVRYIPVNNQHLALPGRDINNNSWYHPNPYHEEQEVNLLIEEDV